MQESEWPEETGIDVACQVPIHARAGKSMNTEDTAIGRPKKPHLDRDYCCRTSQATSSSISLTLDHQNAHSDQIHSWSNSTEVHNSLWSSWLVSQLRRVAIVLVLDVGLLKSLLRKVSYCSWANGPSVNAKRK